MKLRELEFNMLEPLRLCSDKKTSINIAHNPLQHDTTKHVEIDIHFIKENEEQQANILTEKSHATKICSYYCRHVKYFSGVSERTWEALEHHFQEFATTEDRNLLPRSWFCFHLQK